MDEHSSDRSSRLWLPLAEAWQECPAGLEVPGPDAALDHWPLPPYAMGMRRPYAHSQARDKPASWWRLAWLWFLKCIWS